MRKRQLAVMIHTCRPYEAAQQILASGVDLDTVGIELLTERVVAHFRSRLRGEELAHACREWDTATRTGSFQWERANSINGLLASIANSARRREREHRQRHIERHTVTAEPVTHVSFTMTVSEEATVNRHLEVFATAGGQANGFRPALAKRQAIIDCLFPAGFVATPIKDAQASKAIKMSKNMDLSVLAAAVLDGRDRSVKMTAAEAFPYLAGQTGDTQRAVLEVFAGWSAEMCATATSALCYREVNRDKSSDEYGKPIREIICPASEAPELVPLRVA